MYYSAFNNFIKDRFFCSSKIGSYIVLSVDIQVLNEFYKEANVSEEQFRKEVKLLFADNWAFALRRDNFFGLIAIQVFVAHSMTNEHESGGYRNRLGEYFEISQEVLGRLFKEYQDKLWNSLEIWARNSSYYLNLPKKSDGPWSKVKYPLSQTLLNQNDLNHLPLLFKESGLRVNEDMNYNDFRGIVTKSESGQILPNHFLKVKKRLLKEDNLELLYHQVFEYYCNWDGEVLCNEKFKNKTLHKNESINYQIIITSEKDEILIIDNNDQVVKRLDTNCLTNFQSINLFYRLPNVELIFFQKDESYGDWEISRFLVHGKRNLILSKINVGIEILAKILDPCCEIVKKHNCVLTEIEICQDYQPTPYWEHFFSVQRNPVIIKNGLKISRKIWMEKAGPDLVFNDQFDAWINGVKLEQIEKGKVISLRSFAVGEYILKLRDFKPIIIVIKCSEDNSQDCLCGWEISTKPAKWQPSKDPLQISGLINSFSSLSEAVESEVRVWIDANTCRGIKKLNHNIALVTNTVKRSKDGIQY